MSDEKKIFIVTTHDSFEAEDIKAAFEKYTDGYKVSTWKRVFLDSSLPIDECEIRYYWEFKSMVTKDQEEKLKIAINNIEFPMNRGFLA